ncbi:DUF1073 domain-containing protein [Desulfosporosinus sp. PR]|uniref:anti-CBASS protein Acb1 family protein n=1 Tax=Candidatus Desulfosporosinus nitrosoreducens TaxID=3401928 RepID=UPI0027FDD8CD|nr:anti-CBASS Acb1 family protein [Desulfosporosinus sp. PR]MDQ7094202.1 DUF1073 domain-containing protein [Desulfosporosinus sp. PR]
MGSASSNIISAASYPLTRLSRNYMLLNSLYRNSWICNKIVNIIPEDMMKNGWSITAELKPEETDRISKLEQRTLVREKILEGLYWGRLYGGAGAIMIIDGHEDKLDEPLDYDDIMPGSFCGLMVVDRWSGIYPSLELITDHRDPELGMPMYYEVRDTASDRLISKVHHSRVLRFTGKKLPFWEEVAEVNWGSSVMEHVYEEMVKRDSTSWNIASLVFQANLLVDKIDGMDQMLAATDPQVQADFYNIKSAQNQMRSNNGMMIIGKDEELSALTYQFSGLNDISETQMMDVAGAADIPVTRLFGRSPAGMNATGEADLQNYYDMISQQQEKDLKPKINKLMPVMFMSELGYIPDDLGVKFNPVQTPSEDKIADIVGKKVDSLSKTFNDGGINHKMYLSELHELSYTTGMFTSITDEDIAKADDSFYTGESLAEMGERFDNKSAVHDGGPGSGNFGHEGRPGEIGGSDGGGEGKTTLDPKERQRYNKILKGIKTSTGHTVKIVEGHMFDRAAQRGISAESIKKVLENPQVVYPERIDKNGRPSIRFIREDIVVALNPKTGKICTVAKRGDGL